MRVAVQRPDVVITGPVTPAPGSSTSAPRPGDTDRYIQPVITAYATRSSIPGHVTFSVQPPDIVITGSGTPPLSSSVPTPATTGVYIPPVVTSYPSNSSVPGHVTFSVVRPDVVILNPTVGVPGPPIDVAVVRRSGTLDVTWDPPVSIGGGPITGYLVTITETGNQAYTVQSVREVLVGSFNTGMPVLVI